METLAAPSMTRASPASSFHAKLFTSFTHAVLFASLPDRRVIDVNEEFCRMFCVERDAAMRGTTDLMYRSREDFERMGVALAAAIRDGRRGTIEWELRRDDGSTFPAEMTVIEIQGAGGEPSGVVKVIRDLTAEKQEARQADRRRERDAFLTDATSLLLERTLDPEGTLRLVAQLGTRVLGDYANVLLLDEASGALRRVTIAHADPRAAPLVEEYARRYPPQPEFGAILRSIPPGGQLVMNDIAPETILDLAGREGEAELVARIGLKHHLMVPLLGRGGLIGAIGFTRASGEPYDEEDARLARSLAARAALAYENAKLHREVHRSSAALSDFVETSAIGLHWVGPDGTILWANKADHDLLGYAKEEYVGRGIREFHADREVIEDILRRLHNDERLHEYPARLRAKDGSIRHVLIDSSVYWENGAFAHTRCFTRDVTAQRHAEERLRRSEEKLRRILDTAPIQVLTIDEEGRVVTINRSIRGGDPLRFVGLNVFDTIVEEDRERVRSIILDSMRNGTTAEYETRGVLGPGEARWFSVRVGPLELDGMRGAVLVSTDIEERRRIEAEMARVRVQVAQGEKLAALGSLVSGVAHELRTPLTYLSNNAYLLESRLVLAAKHGESAQEAHEGVKRFIGEIKSGVDRIDLLVEDLRKYTKARREQASVEATLGDVLREGVEIFVAAARASHRVEMEFRGQGRVRANKGAIQQLALNLLQNAADASAPGSLIRVVTLDREESAVLEVVDQGSGIPEDVRKRMFDPLFTTKAEGTGLGLSIVERIAIDHGARIECDTALGAGTTFRVIFPRASE